MQLLVAESGQRQHLVELQFARSLTHHHRVSSSHAGAAAEGGPGEELHVMQVNGRECGGMHMLGEGVVVGGLPYACRCALGEVISGDLPTWSGDAPREVMD